MTFAKSPEDTCSSYPIFTAPAFSTDSISNQIKDDIELIKAARKIRLNERRGNIVETTIGKGALEAFETSIEGAAWAQYLMKKQIELADGLRKDIQEGLKAFSARKPLPEVAPLREYLKESYREQKLAEVLDELKKEASIESEPEGKFKRIRARMAVAGATEARKRAKG